VREAVIEAIIAFIHMHRTARLGDPALACALGLSLNASETSKLKMTLQPVRYCKGGRSEIWRFTPPVIMHCPGDTRSGIL